MIKILRDVVGITSDKAVIPFTVENLPEKPLTLEVLLKTSSQASYVVREDLTYRVLDDTEVPVTTITDTDNNSLFVVRINLTEYTDVQTAYIRLYNMDTSFITPEIFIVQNQEATVETKALDLNFRPKTVKILDVVDCTANGSLVDFDANHFGIQVFASNNATSLVPVWEDMTTEYLNKTEYVLKNNKKDSDKVWTIAVKYIIQKKSTNSTVQLSDIKLIVI